jgi:hypothetical protein
MVSYAEIDDDDSPKMKRGRPKKESVAAAFLSSPKPAPAAKTPKVLKTPKSPPKSPPKVAWSPQKLVTPKSLAAASRKEKPLSGKKFRRKRTDSEDSFEIMPYKRRQFVGAAEDDADDESAKDDDEALRTSTPTPPAATSESKADKRIVFSSKDLKLKPEPKKEVVADEDSTINSSKIDEDSTTADAAQKPKAKRGRPRKSDQVSIVYIFSVMAPWRRGLVVSSLPATEETGVMGSEINSR